MQMEKIPLILLDPYYSHSLQPEKIYNQFLECHIPGAIYFDYTKIFNEQAPYLIPESTIFIKYLKELQIKNDNTPTFIYSRLKSQSAARLWYLLKLYGKKNVALLDGGLEKWVSEDYPTDKGPPSAQESDPLTESDYNFTSTGKYKNYPYVSALGDLLSRETPQSLSRIIDARSPLRFLGMSEEPMQGIRSGNIPGSKNLHYTRCFNEDSTYKSRDELLKLFNELNLDLNESGNIIHVSGKGISACSNILAMEIAGYTSNYLYDGSWIEWTQRYNIMEGSISPKSILESAYFKHLEKNKIKYSSK